MSSHSQLHSGPRPSARQRLRIATTMALITLPYVLYLPAWLSLLAGVLFAWQLHAAWRNAPMPGLIVRLGLATLIIAVVWVGWGRINGLEAGSALLLLMLGLKLSEVCHYRDAMLAILLGYFVLVTQCLFSQALPMIAYITVGCILLTTLLIDINAGSDALPLRTLAATATRLLLQVLPIAAVLFVLFPRLAGPLWTLPANHGSIGVTGLSDTMRPGSITRLVRSDAVVLRARFDDPGIQPQTLYWRGPVLWHFDHGSWSVGKLPRHWPAPDILVPSGTTRRSRIIVEPSTSDWLLTPDVPLHSSTPARMTAGATLVASHSQVGARLYHVRWSDAAILQPHLPAAIRAYATALPTQGNPRARALAEQWQAQADSPRAIIRQALALFHNNPYVYTLTPPTLGQHDRIDAFLFASKKGFCAHYAGAFTFLMRAAGLPARVVTGYLGGEASTLGDYWLVRSADAHAWSEVWIRGAGWVRVDPTAAIAPQRVEDGVAAALADDSALPFMARARSGLRYQLEMYWDGINAGWNRWFLAYGPALQARVLSNIGLGHWRNMVLALTALVITLLALVSAWLAWQTRRPATTDAVQRAWLRLGRKLARHGFARASQEGPRDYISRVSGERPDWAPTLQALADEYIALRYAELGSRAAQRQFIRNVARFRPRR